MLVLSSVAIREAHPSPRCCVWDLQDVISQLNWDNHRSLPKLVGETLRVSNFNSSSCLCFLFEREWGIDIGFTYMPKFTLWESLTPEPPELNWGIGTTYPSTVWARSYPRHRRYIALLGGMHHLWDLLELPWAHYWSNLVVPPYSTPALSLSIGKWPVSSAYLAHNEDSYL